MTAWARSVEQECRRVLSNIAAYRVWAAVVIGLIATLMYLPGQFNLPAIDRTEGMVALSSRHVVETGDYLKPRWGPNIQRTRPVGTFWAQGLSIATHDRPAWNDIATYRLPSLLATVAGVVAMFWLAGGIVGAAPAFMASLGVAVTPIVVLHAQLAIAEPLVLPMTIIAQLALLAMYREPDQARWWGWLGAFWISLGVSTWFNALAVPLLAFTTIVVLALWDRRLTFAARLQPVLGVPLLALLALPWLAAVWAIDGGALYKDMSFSAVLDALEGGQSMKFKTAYGVFVLTLVLGFVPIAHMLGPVISRTWRLRTDPTRRFLLVWLLAPIVALEIFSNKPPLYTVQAVMPAGALLAAMAVWPSDVGDGAAQDDLRAWPGMFWGTTLLLAVIGPALFGSVLWVTETPVSLLLLAGYLVFAGLFIFAAWVSAHGFGLAWMASATLGTIALGLWFNGVLMPGLKNFWTAPAMTRVVDQLQACAPGPVHISGFREPSLALAMAGKATIDNASETAQRFSSDTKGYAIVASREFDAFSAALEEVGSGNRPQRLGCFGGFNIARGCALRFEVLAHAQTQMPEGCNLTLAADCSAQHERLRRTLKVPHCR